MKPAFAVAELHHMAQNADHQHAVVLFFVHLIGDKAGEPLLLSVQHEDILHPAQHHDPLEGTADVVRYPQIVGALNAGGVLCRRNDDDRDLVQPCVVLHHPQHVKAVHARHHQIQQQQRDIRALPHQLHRRCAVLGFQIVIAIAQYLLEQGTVDLGIIRDQDLRFLVHGHVSPSAAVPLRARCPHRPDAADLRPASAFFTFIYTLLDFTAKCKAACNISAIFRYFLQTFSFPAV